jgi:hypothetical protein
MIPGWFVYIVITILSFRMKISSLRKIMKLLRLKIK